MSDLPECIQERDGTWHLARPYATPDDAEQAWWRGIECSASEGLTLPSPAVQRQPTCLECYRLYRLSLLPSLPVPQKAESP